MRSVLRILVGSVIIALVAFVMSLILINAWILRYGQVRPVAGTVYPVGIVLGAAVTPQGDLSYALQERVDRALEDYQAGIIEKIFVTGDDEEYYKEVSTVTTYLRNAGVPDEDILQDEYGVDTYDSMWRAVNVFGIERALVYTQQYHLSRSVYIAQSLGMKAFGQPVDKDERWKTSKDTRREFLARIKAFIEVVLLDKPPVLVQE